MTNTNTDPPFIGGDSSGEIYPRVKDAAPQPVKTDADSSKAQHSATVALQGTICAHCSGPLRARRSTRRYCSGACRVAAHRAKDEADTVLIIIRAPDGEIADTIVVPGALARAQWPAEGEAP